MDLDPIDRQLLELVQADCRRPLDALGEAIGLSASAAQRRLRRLRRTGVVEAEVAVVAPASVGRALTLLVEVTVERERADLIDGFKRQMRAAPEVQQCYYVTGEADFLLVMTVRDMEEYEAFVRREFYDNGNVRRFRTGVVMDRVKVGLAVPVSRD